MLLFVAIVTLTFCSHKKTVKQVKNEQGPKLKKETPILAMKSVIFIPVRLTKTEPINSTDDSYDTFSATLCFYDSSGTPYLLKLFASKSLNTSHVIQRSGFQDEIVEDWDAKRREETLMKTRNFYSLITAIPLTELRIETILGKNEVFKIRRQRRDTDLYPEIEELWGPFKFY